MTRRTVRKLALAGALAVLLAGCGSSGDEGRPIPADSKQELDKQLGSIEDRFDFGGGACADIVQNQRSVAATLDNLPDDVDQEVRDALLDGFDRLFELTDEQCDETKGQETEPETTEEETTPTTPPEEEETTPTTPPEEEETTPTTPTTPEQPQDDGTGGGGGNGNGGGGGGGNGQGNGNGGVGGLPVPGEDDGGAIAPGQG